MPSFKDTGIILHNAGPEGLDLTIGNTRTTVPREDLDRILNGEGDWLAGAIYNIAVNLALSGLPTTASDQALRETIERRTYKVWR